MTFAEPLDATPASPARHRPRFGAALWIAAACFASFALSWSHLLDVWRTGTFFDTDDAMRMVQVRDWLAGQGWFDLTAHRLAPPQGLPMHWSRIVDVPVGMLVRVFALMLPTQTAERLARIVFPLTCQVLLILAFLRSARVLCGPRSFGPALLVIVLDGFQFGQFVAGRIDHHAPQIVLLVTMTGALAAGLRGGGWRAGLVAALAAALSLAISLENLPFIVVALGAAVLAWWHRGARTASFVCGLAFGLGGFMPLLFVATVSPARYGAVVNDALSLPHVLLLTLGGLGWGWLAGEPRLAATRGRRSGGLCCLALAIGGIVALLCPGFPGSPYAAVDPLVRTLWLEHVTEALPLSATLRLHPAAFTLILLPLAAGWAASVLAFILSRDEERHAWAFVASMGATGLLGTCWEIRVATSTMPIVAFGGVWAVMRAGRSPIGRTWPLPRLRMLLALVPVSPVLCALLPTGDEPASARAATADAQACRAAEALQPLASLSPGLFLAPIDAGSHLLAHTALTVLGAPYHRNNAGNLAVLDAFLAEPDAADVRVRHTGATYVALCRGDAQLGEMVHAAPAGLAARLQGGETPAWLEPIALADTPYRVWRVR